MEIFYVGAAEPALVKEKMQGIFAGLQRSFIPSLPQTGFQDAGGGMTQVQVASWYDNENSYVSQMVRTIKHFAKLL